MSHCLSVSVKSINLQRGRLMEGIGCWFGLPLFVADFMNKQAHAREFQNKSKLKYAISA